MRRTGHSRLPRPCPSVRLQRVSQLFSLMSVTDERRIGYCGGNQCSGPGGLPLSLSCWRSSGAPLQQSAKMGHAPGRCGPTAGDHLLAHAFNLTASVIGNSYRLADRRVATRASREGSGESDDEASTHGRDRVWDVALGSDRRRLWVGNRREWQIAGAAQRKVVLRGEGRPVRRSRSRKRRCRVWRDGGSRATRALRNRQGPVPA